MDEERARGVQSAEVTVAILEALARGGGPMTLKDVGAACGMAPAKVHRYLASLTQAGMVAHRRSGSYDLGPAAARIGIAAVGRFEPVNRAADLLPELVEATGYTAMLSVWGSGGATVIRWERAAQQLVTALGLGSVLPLKGSATGQVFLGWLPERLLADALGGAIPAQERQAARDAFICEAAQSFIPGLYAIAAPVLDVQGEAAAAVTLISNRPDILAERTRAKDALRAAFAPPG